MAGKKNNAIIQHKKDEKSLAELKEAIYKGRELFQIVVGKISKNDKKKFEELLNFLDKDGLTLFHHALQNGSIEIIKYLLDNKYEIKNFDSNSDWEKVLQIVKIRLEKSNSPENQQIFDYLDKKIETLRNDLNYKKALFNLDLIIVREINQLFQIIKKYCTTPNEVFSRETVSTRFWDLSELPDEILPAQSNPKNETSYQYKILKCLEQIAAYTSFLGNHEGSIKNNINIIPWELLKTIHVHINNSSSFQEYPRKLLEFISPEIYKLANSFDELENFLKKGYENFCVFKKQEIENQNSLYKNLFYISFIPTNQVFILASIKNIEIIESLDFKEEDDKYILIQCLQIIGEINKHFSPIIQEKLIFYGFNFKYLRNAIAHICEQIPSLTKFIKFLKTNNSTLEDIKKLVSEYKKLLIILEHSLLNLNEDSSQAINYISQLSDQNKEILANRWIDKVLKDVVIEESDKIFAAEGYVGRQLEVIKFAIGKIQQTVDTVSEKANHNYSQVRWELKNPKNHTKCLFFLTMIGQAVQAIKTNENFLSVVSFELLKEFDFLKWVRNALMHLDQVKEDGSLVDYLSNDLLTDFSVATHGQKIIEFSKYFNYLSKLIDHFNDQLNSLGGNNYFQSYAKEDKKYLAFDIQKRTNDLSKALQKYKSARQKLSSSRKDNRQTITLARILSCPDIYSEKTREAIEQKCSELSIEIIGFFGNLSKYGFCYEDGNSGMLVSVTNGDMLHAISEFKQYLYDLFKFRIKVVEERQFYEYIELKINNPDYRSKFENEFLKKTRRCSFEHLVNNLYLIIYVNLLSTHAYSFLAAHEDFLKSYSLLGDQESNRINCILHLKSNKESFEQYFNFVKKIINQEKISFELIAPNHTPVLHSLYKIFQDTNFDEIFDLISILLERGADINVQDKYGNTLLHQISHENFCDEEMLQLIIKYEEQINFNLCNLNGECALEFALKSHNSLLIEFLKTRINIKQYKENLLRTATKYGNFNFVEHLIAEHHVDVNMQDENKRPFIHYALFRDDLYLSDYAEIDEEELSENYRKIIQLYLQNGAKIGSYQKNHEVEIPLLDAIEKEDILLAIQLAENSGVVSYPNQDGICPIHLAILNLKHSNLEQRQDYLKLISELAKKSINSGVGLEQEYKNYREIPLYLAAQSEDIEVMRILLSNGAKVNYKNHRFEYQILNRVKNFEVIKLLLDSGLRLNFTSCIKSLENRKNACNEALNELEKINIDRIDFNKLKTNVEAIYGKVSSYVEIEYINFDRITKEKIKIVIEKLKSSLRNQKSNKFNLDSIKAYLIKHAELFNLYKNKQIEELKTLSKDTEINWNVVDQEGKNLFWYAVESNDLDFLEWLHNKIHFDLNATYLFPARNNPEREFTYYDHLANCVNGEVLDFLVSFSEIDFKIFDDVNVRNICERAIKKQDLKLLQIFELYKYLDFKESNISIFPEENSIKQYLQCYIQVFNQLKNNENIEVLKVNIQNLKNKFIIFNNMSLLHMAVAVDNFTITQFLVKEIKIAVNIVNFSESTALDIAIEEDKSVEIIGYLITQKANISRNFNFESLLSLSNDKRQLLIPYLKTCLELQQDLFEQATSYLDNPDVIQLLLELGWNPSTYSNFGSSALHECVSRNHNETLEVLFASKKVDVEAIVGNFFILAVSGAITPVGWALEHRNYEGAKILIQYGASPYKYLIILLVDALRNYDVDYVKLLLEKSIIVDPDKTKTYLNGWIQSDFPKAERYKALQSLYCLNVNIVFPSHIFEQIISILNQDKIGPDKIPGCDLIAMGDFGDSFYMAIVDQLELIAPNLKIQLQDLFEEAASHREIINFARKNLNLIIAIIDTRNLSDKYIYYFTDSKMAATVTNEKSNLPQWPIIKIAYTGSCYFSIRTELNQVKEFKKLQEIIDKFLFVSGRVKRGIFAGQPPRDLRELQEEMKKLQPQVEKLEIGEHLISISLERIRQIAEKMGPKHPILIQLEALEESNKTYSLTDKNGTIKPQKLLKHSDRKVKPLVTTDVSKSLDPIKTYQTYIPMIESIPKLPSKLEQSQKKSKYEIKTLHDGNCAFNAVAIGICNLIMQNKLPINPGTKMLFLELKIESIKEWLTINSNWNMRQKTFAEVLRRIAITEIIKNDAANSLYEERLWEAYVTRSEGTDDTFIVHNHIKEKFQEQNLAENTLITWWRDSGKAKYFETLAQSAENALDKKRWGSEIEVEYLANLFEINIAYEKNGARRILGIGSGVVSNLIQEEKDRLITFDVIALSQNSLTLKQHKTRKEFENLLKIFTPLDGDKIRQLHVLIEQATQVHLHNRKFPQDEMYANLKESLIRLKILVLVNNEYLFIAQDTAGSIINKAAILNYLKGIDDQLKNKLLDSYREDIAIFTVSHMPGQWDYIPEEDSALAIQSSNIVLPSKSTSSLYMATSSSYTSFHVAITMEGKSETATSFNSAEMPIEIDYENEQVSLAVEEFFAYEQPTSSQLQSSVEEWQKEIQANDAASQAKAQLANLVDEENIFDDENPAWNPPSSDDEESVSDASEEDSIDVADSPLSSPQLS